MKKEIPSINWFVALGHANTIIRTTAVEALGKGGLLTALQHPEWTIRQAAAEELVAFLPMHDVQEALTTTLFSDEDSLVRATIVRTLSYLGQQTPIDSLVKALQNEKDDWEVREMILSVFGDLAELAPLEPIIASLQDPEELVRAVAVRTLGKYKRNIPIKPLVDALFDASPMVQEQAATILWNSNEQGQAALLHVCSQEPDDPITSLVHRLRSQQQGHTQHLLEQVNMFLHVPQSFSSHNDGEDIPTNSLKQSDEQRFADNLHPVVESDDIRRQKQSSMKRQIDNQHSTEAKRHYAEGEATMHDTTPPIDPLNHRIHCTSPKKRRYR